MVQWIKALISAGQQILLAFSSYEYGKNVELEEQNERLAIIRATGITKAVEVKEDQASTSYVYPIGAFLLLVVILIALRELKKCFRINRVENDHIELNSLRNELTRRQNGQGENSSANGIRVQV